MHLRTVGEFNSHTHVAYHSAPEFDGRMDSNAFSDWLVVIKEYFDWYEMIDSE